MFFINASCTYLLLYNTLFSSFLFWSSNISASITSSNFPSITLSSCINVKLILWSVSLFCGKLYVLIFSDLSPVPILLLLSAPSFSSSAGW